MHSEAATIGEIVHPVAGSTARGTVAIVVVGAVVGSGTGGNVTVGRAGFWRRGASLRRRAELQPLPDAARTEPGLSGDVADEGSSLTQSMDLIKDGLPRATMRLAGQVSMFCDFAWATRTI